MSTVKSKILVIGGTGYIGKYVVGASAKLGHPTFVLVRESTVSNGSKSSIIDDFKNQGVQLIYGDLSDHESMVSAIKQFDVVISTVGGEQLIDQVKIIAAIREAGNVKRFIPSEFGYDIDRVRIIEPAESFFQNVAKIRRAIEAEGIPHTYICSYGFAGYHLANFGQENATAPPRDKIVILGNGNAKSIYVEEQDIATYTIKAADDPRTMNKVLELKPAANILSFNELIALWEKKIGKTLEKIFVSDDEVLKTIQESSFPKNFLLSLQYSIVGIGTIANSEEKDSVAVEATDLYPEVKYTTVDDYLDCFV